MSGLIVPGDLLDRKNKHEGFASGLIFPDDLPDEE